MDGKEIEKFENDDTDIFDYNGFKCKRTGSKGLILIENCSNDKNIAIPEGITEISYFAFQNSKIRSVKFPDSLLIIGFKAFDQCSDLTDVQFGHGPVDIGERAFNKCESLEYVDFENVRTIGLYAFANCTGIRSVKLHDGLIFIGSGAFDGCFNLKKISLPSSVKKLGRYSLGFANEIHLEKGCIPYNLLVSSCYDGISLSYTLCIGKSKFIIPNLIKISAYHKALKFLQDFDTENDKTIVLYDWANFVEDRQEIALEGYHLDPNPKTRSYLRRYGVSILKNVENEESFISSFNRFLSDDLMTQKIAERILPIVQEKNWTKATACVLEYLKMYTQNDAKKDGNVRFRI